MDQYKSGLNNDVLNLIYNANKKCRVAIKTPIGLTERIEISDIWMQEDVFASLGCRNQVDRFTKEYQEENDFAYKYKDAVSIPSMLGIIDDILAIQECGPKSEKINTFQNRKVSDKKTAIQYR